MLKRLDWLINLNIKIEREKTILRYINLQPEQITENKKNYINNLTRLYNSEKFFWMKAKKEL
ncbi:hypothetical protein GWN26_01150 [Candidatus Saccharibacteria bacterium]|nr:hypothetical protein [Candidatus Saccharibacteria bacterium]NIV03211.1 hypothetical protein [Calditrichia bacterium]NIV71323.1 hypothetical protein [Calditrichia bacterium]NIV97815.1 hypothetical protein [Candidatus Saccharibacteria bacterium]NIW78101.1 hypothetical protein [Calditrichia bacterium]